MDSRDRWKRSFEPVAQPAATARPTSDSTTASAAAPASVVHRPLPLPQQQALPASHLPTAVPHQSQRARAWSVDPSPAVEPRPMDRAGSESAGTRGAVGTTSGMLDLDVDRWLEEACRGPSAGGERSASSSTTLAAEDIKPWPNEVHGAERNGPRKSFKSRLPPPPTAQPMEVQGKPLSPAFKSRLPPASSAAPTSTATSTAPPTTIVQPLAQSPAPIIAEPARADLPQPPARIKRVELLAKSSFATASPPSLPQRPPPARPNGPPEEPVVTPQPASNGQLATPPQPADSSAPACLPPPPSINAPVAQRRDIAASFSTVEGSSISAQAEARSSPPALPQPAPPPPPVPVKHTQTESTPQPQDPTTSQSPLLSSKEKALALLPQHGTQFTSPEAFYVACLKSCLKAYRVPTWKNSDSTSTLRAECSLRKRKGCRFSIAAVRSHGKWVVNEGKSRLEHNHAWEGPLDGGNEDADSDDDLPLVQRPNRLNPRRGSSQPDPAAHTTSSTPTSPSSTSKPSATGVTSPRVFQPLDSNKPAPPMVKVGDTFDSRFTIHCAASKAAYARGFAIVVSKSLGDGSILGFSCRRGVNQSGLSLAERCHFKLDVEVTENDDGEEQWKVTRLDEEHNHLPSTQAALGEWKEPRGEQQVRRYSSKPSTIHSEGEEESSEDGSSEEDFQPTRKQPVSNGSVSENDSDVDREISFKRKKTTNSASPVPSSRSTSDNIFALRTLHPHDSTKAAPPFPRVGDVFSSRKEFHTSASKAGYARGFFVVIYQTFDTNSKLIFSCGKSTKGGGFPLEHRCPFRIAVKVTSDKSGRERWDVQSVSKKHNHAGVPPKEMGPWRPPQKPRGSKKSESAEKGRSRRGEMGANDEGSSSEDDGSEDDELPPPPSKRQRSSSTTSSAPPLKKHRAASSLLTPRPSKTPPTISSRYFSALKPDASFLPSLTSFLIALAPSLGQFAPILLSLGVDLVEAVVELTLLDEAELERFVKADRRGEAGGEGTRSLMELPPMERAKLKSGLKKGRAWIDGGAARPSL
ncbi:hypothetical protein BCR35DRAFT_311198 [Leucosporidium creatinivorum]|uniref:FAR1 domain-containing protein n=1 Tax=Leucosporidium creatinivorum TaxID=106004 RepID=A0A1Y2C969_9BASI|nr:hypothetical protein BCR35DRAFT_311198 [Leucosporidium creatinivorum]